MHEEGSGVRPAILAAFEDNVTNALSPTCIYIHLFAMWHLEKSTTAKQTRMQARGWHVRNCYHAGESYAAPYDKWRLRSLQGALESSRVTCLTRQREGSGNNQRAG